MEAPSQLKYPIAGSSTPYNMLRSLSTQFGQ